MHLVDPLPVGDVIDLRVERNLVQQRVGHRQTLYIDFGEQRKRIRRVHRLSVRTTSQPTTRSTDEAGTNAESRSGRQRQNIYRMPSDGGPLEAVTHFPDTPPLFIVEPTITADGRYLVYARRHGGSAIWLLTLGR
jgi:hypothetical protein